MRCKLFGLDPPEVTILILINTYLVITRLPRKVLPPWMQRRGRNRPHLRIRHMFGHNRNPILPDKELFVIGRADKLILLYKIDSVDSAQMLTVLKLFGACVEVKLQYFLVIRAHKEGALDCGMEFAGEGNSLEFKRTQYYII